MPTPPRESIGGTKPKQILDFNFHITQFEYLVELENFKTSEDYESMEEGEKITNDLILQKQTESYDLLREIVDTY